MRFLTSSHREGVKNFYRNDKSAKAGFLLRFKFNAGGALVLSDWNSGLKVLHQLE